MYVQDIAAICHEINRAYCLAIGEAHPPAWEDAPQWQKDSALNGVKFHIVNPEATPEASHANWMAVKLADGWRYGQVKDAEQKTHPCLTDYALLPIEQRAKDHLFAACVRACVRYAG